ncbi:MAG: hypothetical protein KDA21_15405 [Phycisphaerales bacterium]|nr:hypothetical protein [Phycisphaerales bacterium]
MRGHPIQSEWRAARRQILEALPRLRPAIDWLRGMSGLAHVPPKDAATLAEVRRLLEEARAALAALADTAAPDDDALHETIAGIAGGLEAVRMEELARTGEGRFTLPRIHPRSSDAYRIGIDNLALLTHPDDVPMIWFHINHVCRMSGGPAEHDLEYREPKRILQHHLRSAAAEAGLAQYTTPFDEVGRAVRSWLIGTRGMTDAEAGRVTVAEAIEWLTEGDFAPIAWFQTNTRIPPATLRQAAAPDRKTKRLRRRSIDGQFCYSKSDAKRNWPGLWSPIP